VTNRSVKGCLYLSRKADSKKTQLKNQILLMQMSSIKIKKIPVCKSKCQKDRLETEVSLANLAVKFASLEKSLTKRLYDLKLIISSLKPFPLFVVYKGESS
jgi:hypothetical protein